MPKTFYDGKRAIRLLDARPENFGAITPTEANAGEDISDLVLTTSVLGPSGSDTVAEKVWSSKGNAEAFGASNFSGNQLIIHRYFDTETGQAEATKDKAWAAAYAKGTELRILTRTSGKDSHADFAEDDEYRYIEYTTDDPQYAEGEGYIKATIPLAYSGVHALDQKIAAAD